MRQSVLIDNANKYLKHHNLPLRLNKKGMCGGLSTLYAKYWVKGEHREFFRNLKSLALKKPSSAIDLELNHFIVEMSLAQDKSFHKQLNPSTRMKILSVDDQPFSAAFTLGMVTTDKNWQAIIEEIDLKESEVMLVHANRHCVAVRKTTAGHYIIYDPNHSEEESFRRDSDLIRALQQEVFGKRLSKAPQQLSAMRLKVVQHPNSPLRTFPSVEAIYNKYLDNTRVNQRLLFKNPDTKPLNVTTLLLAAELNDAEAIKKLIKLGATEEKNNAAHMASIANCPQALEILLSHFKKENSDIQTCLQSTLQFGHEEAFDALLNHEKTGKIAQDLLATKPDFFIYHASKGGNVALLSKVIARCRDNMSACHPQFIDSKIAAALLKKHDTSDTIHEAIKEGNRECVQLLMGQLKNTTYALDEKSKLNYLLTAIRENKPYIALMLIDNMAAPKAALKTITMSLSAIWDTDLYLLKLLRTHGVIFSKTAEAMIAKKEHQPLGVWMTIKLQLIVLIEFLKNILFKTPAVHYDKENYRFFKKNPSSAALFSPSNTVAPQM